MAVFVVCRRAQLPRPGQHRLGRDRYSGWKPCNNVAQAEQCAAEDGDQGDRTGPGKGRETRFPAGGTSGKDFRRTERRLRNI
jgi:hypothetical protein